MGFDDCRGGGGRGEVVEEDVVVTLLLLLFPGDGGDVMEEAGWRPRPLGGGSRFDEDDGAFRPCISASSFFSVSLRSATRSAIRASKSLSSRSCRDAGGAESNHQDLIQMFYGPFMSP